MLELYVVTALASISLFAITSILSKYLIPLIGGPYRFLTLHLGLGFPILILLALFEYENGFESEVLLKLDIWLIILITSVFALFGYISILIGFERGKASVGGIVLSSRAFASIPLGFLFLGERYPVAVYLLIFVTLVGAVTVSWDVTLNIGEVIRLEAPGMKYFTIAAFFWACANVLISMLDGEIPPFIFLAIRQIIMLSLTLFFYRIGSRNFDSMNHTIDFVKIRRVLVYVFILVSAQALFVYSLGKSLTVTEGIGVAEGAVTFIFSIVVASFIDNSVLQEPMDRKSLLLRTAGVFLATIGTLGVVFYTS
ncbi:MAG: EamA family transporter [Candidatus Kariarchaeaceae archaeon]